MISIIDLVEVTLNEKDDFLKVREAYEHEQQSQNMMNDEQEGVAAHG